MNVTKTGVAKYDFYDVDPGRIYDRLTRPLRGRWSKYLNPHYGSYVAGVRDALQQLAKEEHREVDPGIFADHPGLLV